MEACVCAETRGKGGDAASEEGRGDEQKRGGAQRRVGIRRVADQNDVHYVCVRKGLPAGTVDGVDIKAGVEQFLHRLEIVLSHGLKGMRMQLKKTLEVRRSTDDEEGREARG